MKNQDRGRKERRREKMRENDIYRGNSHDGYKPNIFERFYANGIIQTEPSSQMHPGWQWRRNLEL